MKSKKKLKAGAEAKAAARHPLFMIEQAMQIPSVYAGARERESIEWSISFKLHQASLPNSLLPKIRKDFSLVQLTS